MFFDRKPQHDGGSESQCYNRVKKSRGLMSEWGFLHTKALQCRPSNKAIWILSSIVGPHTVTEVAVLYHCVAIYSEAHNTSHIHSTSIYKHPLDLKVGRQCESLAKKSNILFSHQHQEIAHMHKMQLKSFYFFAELARNAEQITSINGLPGCGWNSQRFDSDVWGAAIALRYSHSKVRTYVQHTLYNT